MFIYTKETATKKSFSSNKNKKRSAKKVSKNVCSKQTTAKAQIKRNKKRLSKKSESFLKSVGFKLK